MKNSVDLDQPAPMSILIWLGLHCLLSPICPSSWSFSTNKEINVQQTEELALQHSTITGKIASGRTFTVNGKTSSTGYLPSMVNQV